MSVELVINDIDAHSDVLRSRQESDPIVLNRKIGEFIAGIVLTHLAIDEHVYPDGKMFEMVTTNPRLLLAQILIQVSPIHIDIAATLGKFSDHPRDQYIEYIIRRLSETFTNLEEGSIVSITAPDEKLINLYKNKKLKSEAIIDMFQSHLNTNENKRKKTWRR